MYLVIFAATDIKTKIVLKKLKLETTLSNTTVYSLSKRLKLQTKNSLQHRALLLSRPLS